MIDIKKSKLRQDLLILFLSNEGSEFYMRQLERVTGHFVGNIQKDLKVLEQNGLFTKRKEANRVYYKINKEYRYWDEIKRDIVNYSSPKQIMNTISDLAEKFTEIYKRDAKKAIPPYDLIFVGNTEREVVEKYLQRLNSWTDHTWKYSFIKPNDNEYLMIQADPRTSLVWEKE